MSMSSCQKCGAWVDTDCDTDCYQPDPRHSLRHNHPEICVCESCREKEIEDGEKQ